MRVISLTHGGCDSLASQVEDETFGAGAVWVGALDDG